MKNNITDFIQEHDLIYSLQESINEDGFRVYSKGIIQMQNAVTIRITPSHNTILKNEDIEALTKHLCKCANEFRNNYKL